MATFRVSTRAGAIVHLEGKDGHSLMELVRGGVDDIEALCGGSCACATCHVYVDDAFRERLPQLSEDEDDLLDTSAHRTERSRLSCQIKWTPQLDGLRIEIAPAD